MRVWKIHRQEPGLIGIVSEEDSKVLSEKLHEIRNIINEELRRPNDKDLIFFPDKRFRIDSDGVVYFNDKNLSIKKTGKPRKASGIFDAMGGKKEAIKIFNIAAKEARTKLNTKEAVALNNMDNNLPSTSEITQATAIEMKDIVESVIDNNEEFIDSMKYYRETYGWMDDSFGYAEREIRGFDKGLKTIRGSLKVAVGKMTETENHIKLEERKLQEIKNNPEIYTDDQRKEVRDRMKNLNDDLTARKEEVDILRGKLKSQITGIRETIAKVLDSDTSLAEKIRTSFREQGVTIAAILTAFGAVVAAIVESLTGSSPSIPPSSSTPGGGGGDKKGAKEWIKDQLKALASLLGKLASKAADALPGIIGSIVSWLLSRAKEVVGWLSYNLWALVVGVGGLLYTYMLTRKKLLVIKWLV